MPEVEEMLGFAVLGIAANGFAVFKLGGAKTLNEKVLNWYLLEGVLGCVAMLLVADGVTIADQPAKLVVA